MTDSTESNTTNHDDTTHEELQKEILLIAATFGLTGKIHPDTLEMLLQTALLADILLRQKKEADEAHKQLLLDLQTESFSKDIEIANLRAELENRAL